MKFCQNFHFSSEGSSEGLMHKSESPHVPERLELEDRVPLVCELSDLLRKNHCHG